jgi:hypothetical protein
MDEYGNPVMNLYIRKVERKREAVNTVVKIPVSHSGPPRKAALRTGVLATAAKNLEP